MNPNNEPPRVVLEEDSNWSAIKYYHQPSDPKMIQWVVKYSGGLIKNVNQAGYVLVGFAIIIIAISLYLFFGDNQGQNIQLPPGTKVIYSQNGLPRLERPLVSPN